MKSHKEKQRSLQCKSAPLPPPPRNPKCQPVEANFPSPIQSQSAASPLQNPCHILPIVERNSYQCNMSGMLEKKRQISGKSRSGHSTADSTRFALKTRARLSTHFSTFLVLITRISFPFACCYVHTNTYSFPLPLLLP